MDNFSTNNTHSPQENHLENENGNSSFSSKNSPNVFALFARSLGIFSIFCAFFSMFFGTFICGGLAVILALLSKGYNTKMEKNARIGFVSGIVGIIFQISVFIFSIYNILYVPEYRQQFNSIYEKMYGESLEDSLDDILNNLGLPEMKGGNL